MTDKIINPYKNLLCEVETQKKLPTVGKLLYHYWICYYRRPMRASTTLTT